MSERSFCSSSSGRSRQSFGEVPPSSSEAYLCLSKPIAVFESFEQTQPKTNSQTPPVTIFFDHVLNQVKCIFSWLWKKKLIVVVTLFSIGVL